MIRLHATETKRRYIYTLKELRTLLKPYVQEKWRDNIDTWYPQQSPTQSKGKYGEHDKCVIEFRWREKQEDENTIIKGEWNMRVEVNEIKKMFGLTGTPYEFGLWCGRSPMEEEEGVSDELDEFYFDTVEGNLMGEDTDE